MYYETCEVNGVTKNLNEYEITALKIVPKINSGSPESLSISLISLALLSDCDCAQTSFFRNSYTQDLNPTEWSDIQVNAGEVKLIYLNLFDSVSSYCGARDGYTFCGTRSLLPPRDVNGNQVDNILSYT
jgi:hypothetical protein